MTARTAWAAGNGAGFTWTTAINTADLASMEHGAKQRGGHREPDRTGHVHGRVCEVRDCFQHHRGVPWAHSRQQWPAHIQASQNP